MICSFEVILQLIPSLRFWKLIESDFSVILEDYMIQAILRASEDDTAEADNSFPIVCLVIC